MAETGNIAKALAMAQSKMVQPKKDRTVTVRSDKGNYEFSYATLDSVIEAARGPLTENGIAFIQATAIENDRLCIVTSLLHESGERIDSILPVPGRSDAPAQQLGSAISYAKRYALSSLLGIVAAEDDDANISEGNTVEKTGRGRGKGAARAQDASPEPASEEAKTRFANNRATVDAWQNLHRMLGKNGCTVLSNDSPRYIEYRKWLHAKLELALNEPVPSFSTLSAEAVTRATTIINDWFTTENLKPFTIEETLL